MRGTYLLARLSRATGEAGWQRLDQPASYDYLSQCLETFSSKDRQFCDCSTPFLVLVTGRASPQPCSPAGVTATAQRSIERLLSAKTPHFPTHAVPAHFATSEIFRTQVPFNIETSKSYHIPLLAENCNAHYRSRQRKHAVNFIQKKQPRDTFPSPHALQTPHLVA